MIEKAPRAFLRRGFCFFLRMACRAVAGAGVLLETHGSKDIPEEFLRRGTVRPVDL